ncbi:MAG: lysophospholipid acyltransferase family protein [Planctomycetes bacterium]|nr:lysophospholipid acyltransferase family protein [Planctomycetota bacterium]
MKRRRPGGNVFGTSVPLADRVLALDRLGRIHESIASARTGEEYCRAALAALDVRVRVTAADLARIPRSGPVLVVANHPFGAVEGLALAAALATVRPDVRILANRLLSRIPQLGDSLLFVDVFAGTGAPGANVSGLREALRFLGRGGLLAVFPAGEVAHIDLSSLRVTDPEWNAGVARLAARARAAIVPVYIPGRNPSLFQAAGLLHPRLRTALLPRELLNKRHRAIELAIGGPIPWARLVRFETDRDRIEYLRRRTFFLAARRRAPGRGEPEAPRTLQAVASARPAGELVEEVRLLPAEQRLVASGERSVLCARASQIPAVLLEIGRLRELAFRGAGEGTGRSLDLDRFDETYVHLFLWDGVRREIAGAYRLAAAHEIAARLGPGGLYTHTLFEYGLDFLAELGPALELGRSFVRLERQRSSDALALLWRGIARFLALRPGIRTLFGAVSISSDYSPVSRGLVARFLERHAWREELARRVRPRSPFRVQGVGRRPARQDAPLAFDLAELSALVADLEPDRKGVPVLLRRYLELGGRAIAMNVDHDFGDTLDALVVVDLARANPRVLSRYLDRGVDRSQVPPAERSS